MAVGVVAQVAIGALVAVACSPSAPPADSLGNPPGTGADGGADSSHVGAADGSLVHDGSPSDVVRADVLADAQGNLDSNPTDGLASDAAADDAPGAAAESGAEGGAAVPVCNPALTWGPAFRIPSLPQDTFARFGGIGVDELAIAWTSAAGTIYFADRPTRADDFGAPSIIGTGATPTAVDRVALSATGRAVFAVSADRTRVIGFDRIDVDASDLGVDAAWSPSSTLQFQNVNAMASSEQSSQFSEPVLGGDGTSFFFLLGSAGSPPVLYESTFDAQSREWTTGVALAAFASGATSTTYATGASSDGLTLFFYDGAMAQERAAWRDTVTSPFTLFADMPSVPQSAPNFLCTTLYIQTSDPADAGDDGAFIAQPH